MMFQDLERRMGVGGSQGGQAGGGGNSLPGVEVRKGRELITAL